MVIFVGCVLLIGGNITTADAFVQLIFLSVFSCVDRKSSDLGLGGMRREYLQTDCAINGVL